MLKVVCLSHPDQKLNFVEGFDETKQTWVVSDLRTKFELQSVLLSRLDGYEDLSVIRASELWRLLLRRLRPELRVAPRDFVTTWLTHHLKKIAKGSGGTSILQPQAAPSFLSMMDLFAPLFLNPEGPGKLAEFFAEQAGAAERWEEWSTLSYALFQVIKEENWILPAWIPAVLSTESDLEQTWDRSLFVDLGAGLRQSEVDLFKRLSRKVDVTVFVPNLEEQSSYRFLLQPSAELTSAADQVIHLPLRKTERASQTLRFSGPLAEVKQAVAQARAWLESGVPAGKIAIIAPDIEDYWPLLEPFLQKEGIATQKDGVTRLQSWPSVSGWLSRLRLRAGQVTYSDVETGLNADDLKLRFEKFRALFKNSLELEDLEKSKELESFFGASGPLEKDELTFEQFMAWSARDWRDTENWEGFEILLKELLTSIPASIQMDLEAWIGLMESLSVKKEVRLKPAELGGIALVNLSSVDGSQFERRFFMGLTENNFRKKSNVLVGAHELNRLGWDFGYFLDHPEQNVLTFELQWCLQTPSERDVLSFPATGFTGAPEAPHPIWIQKGGPGAVSIPDKTRWDEIQNSGLIHNEKLQRDLGQRPMDILQLKDKPRFSASAIERYRNCAFQFAAERVFHLLDVPEKDLDLDARSKGSLAHKLFEFLTAQPRRFEWSDEELRELLDKLREETRLQDRDGLFWEIEKERHVQIAKRFLKFEKEWAQEYPTAQIEAREKQFKFYFEPSNSSFHADPQSPQSLLIQGSIDRVESEPSGWKLVVDYKTNHDSRKNFANWIRDNQLQLGFYSWVIDRGFAQGLTPGKVGGAVTFAYKKMEKRKGFVAPELVGLFAPKPEPKDASLEKKELFYLDLESLLVQVLNDAQAGKFNPFPLEGNLQICDNCRWSKVCRAVHLNN